MKKSSFLRRIAFKINRQNVKVNLGGMLAFGSKIVTESQILCSRDISMLRKIEGWEMAHTVVSCKLYMREDLTLKINNTRNLRTIDL